MLLVCVHRSASLVLENRQARLAFSVEHIIVSQDPVPSSVLSLSSCSRWPLVSHALNITDHTGEQSARNMLSQAEPNLGSKTDHGIVELDINVCVHCLLVFGSHYSYL